MHICYLSHTSDIRGGGERALVELVRHVREQHDWRLTVVSPPGPLVDELGEIRDIEHRVVPFAIVWRTLDPTLLVRFAGRYARAVARLRRLLRAERPSVVHANSMTAALYGGLAARGLGVPVIWHMRDIQPPGGVFRLLLPAIGRMVERVVAITEAVRQNLISFGIDKRKIALVYDSVHPVRLHGGAEFRRRWGVGAEDVVLGVVGQILHRKGQLTAVRALRVVVDELPQVRLMICGGNEDSEYGQRLAAEVDRLDLRHRVVFTGFQRDPGPAFDALDILLVPSNQEPFGRVVAEAMFAGKPLVASRVGGIPELVRDEVDGLLFTPGDEAQLATAIRRVVRQEAPVEAMVASARERAAREFSWQGRTEAIRALYDELAR